MIKRFETFNIVNITDNDMLFIKNIIKKLTESIYSDLDTEISITKKYMHYLKNHFHKIHNFLGMKYSIDMKFMNIYDKDNHSFVFYKSNRKIYGNVLHDIEQYAKTIHVDKDIFSYKIINENGTLFIVYKISKI